MKNIFIVFFLLLLGLSSCEKLLEEEVYTSKDKSIYQQEETAIAAVNGVYEVMQSHFYFRAQYFKLLELSSPLFTRHVAKRNEEPLTNLVHTPEEVNLTNVWEQLYRCVNRANDVLKNLDTEDAEIDAVLKDRLVGEVLFLRAMSYFNLVRIWGGVPLQLSVTSNFEDAFLPRSSVQDVYTQIIADLERSFELLPAVQDDKGRAAKYSSAGLLAKVYLTMAGNDASSPYWQKAKDWALIVYTEGPYSLVSNFADLWGGPETSLKNSTESLFEVQFTEGTDNGSNIPMLTYPWANRQAPVSGGNGWGVVRTTKKAYDDFIPGDYRIECTFVGSDLVKAYPTSGYNKSSQGWPYIAKYYDADALDKNEHRCNFIYLRYSDILLILAEAENEISGPAAAFTYVDEVLARARNANGTPRTEPANWDRALTQDEFRALVLKERRIELLGECHSWFDLVRRGSDEFIGCLRAVENDPNNDIVNGVSLDPVWPESDEFYINRMLFPIPAIEIATNPKISTSDQNPGY